MKRSLGTIAAVAAFALTLAACGGNTKPAGTTAPSSRASSGPATSGPAVTIAMFVFQPGSLSVSAGTKVTWTNTDEILHTVTAGSGSEDATGLYDGQLPDAGATFSFTFEKAGTYEYFCDRHPSVPGMHGAIVVT